MKTKNLRINLIVTGLILIGFASRFFIEIPNFTAIGAIALFSGAYLSNKKLAIVIPVLILFVSDLILGLHKTMLFVYIPFLLIIFMGFYLQNNRKPLIILGASLLGSIVFYLISNFGVWVTGMGYSPVLSQVYVDGIPFFRNMIAADLAFNAILFTSAYYIFEKTTVISALNE
ncbi:MAG: hypothetical protein ISR55_04040 [Bacteroidetes bacterium]|nr:hypothetical protein [Bacteroidota bacterium]MBL6962969.1 hypothetical protein [Bacteroidota bacterium]